MAAVFNVVGYFGRKLTMNISINISNIGGTDVYSLSRKNEPGYFQQVMTSKQEGDKKAELSGEQLDELRKKYNTGRFMSDKETSDLMSDLADMGLLSRNFARDISFGFVPMSMEDLHRTTLEACPSNYSALNVISQVRGFDSMQATYEKIKEVSPRSEYTKKYLSDYETYMSVLEKIRS